MELTGRARIVKVSNFLRVRLGFIVIFFSVRLISSDMLRAIALNILSVPASILNNSFHSHLSEPGIDLFSISKLLKGTGYDAEIPRHVNWPLFIPVSG